MNHLTVCMPTTIPLNTAVIFLEDGLGICITDSREFNDTNEIDVATFMSARGLGIAVQNWNSEAQVSATEAAFSHQEESII